MPEDLDKIKELKKIREQKKLDFDIEIDGGINFDNCKSAIDAGANILVSGTTAVSYTHLTLPTTPYV